MTGTCPCCGKPLTSDEIKVDLNSNTLAVGWVAEQVSLSPQTAEVAFALAQVSPKFIPMAALTAAVWGKATVAGTALRNHIGRLREQIAPLGLQVVAQYGAGYAIRRVGG